MAISKENEDQLHGMWCKATPKEREALRAIQQDAKAFQNSWQEADKRITELEDENRTLKRKFGTSEAEARHWKQKIKDLEAELTGEIMELKAETLARFSREEMLNLISYWSNLAKKPEGEPQPDDDLKATERLLLERKIEELKRDQDLWEKRADERGERINELEQERAVLKNWIETAKAGNQELKKEVESLRLVSAEKTNMILGCRKTIEELGKDRQKCHGPITIKEVSEHLQRIQKKYPYDQPDDLEKFAPYKEGNTYFGPDLCKSLNAALRETIREVERRAKK